MCRYPYRDPNTSLGYVAHQRPYPAVHAPLDRYYTTDWTSGQAKYPPQQFVSSYEAQPPPVAPAYTSTQRPSSWNSDTDSVLMEQYQKIPSGRASQGMGTPNSPYPYYHKVAHYPPQPQACLADTSCMQPRGHHGSYLTPTQYPKPRFSTMSEGFKPEEAMAVNNLSHRLYRPWVMEGCQEDSVGLDGQGADLDAAKHSPLQLQLQAGSDGQDPQQVGDQEDAEELQKEYTQL